MSTHCSVILEKKLKSDITKTVWHLCNNFRVNEEDDENQATNPRIELKTFDMGFQNYETFGWLAGVRYNQEPFVEPRGLPDDCHKLVKKEFESGLPYYFEPTWYNMKELMDFAANMKYDATPDLFDGNMQEYKAYEEQFNEEKGLVEDFIDTIIDYIFRLEFEYDFHEDTGLTRMQYFYKEFAENYRVILWFS